MYPREAGPGVRRTIFVSQLGERHQGLPVTLHGFVEVTLIEIGQLTGAVTCPGSGSKLTRRTSSPTGRHPLSSSTSRAAVVAASSPSSIKSPSSSYPHCSVTNRYRHNINTRSRLSTISATAIRPRCPTW